MIAGIKYRSSAIRLSLRIEPLRQIPRAVAFFPEESPSHTNCLVLLTVAPVFSTISPHGRGMIAELGSLVRGRVVDCHQPVLCIPLERIVCRTAGRAVIRDHVPLASYANERAFEPYATQFIQIVDRHRMAVLLTVSLLRLPAGS